MRDSATSARAKRGPLSRFVRTMTPSEMFARSPRRETERAVRRRDAPRRAGRSRRRAARARLATRLAVRAPVDAPPHASAAHLGWCTRGSYTTSYFVTFVRPYSKMGISARMAPRSEAGDRFQDPHGMWASCLPAMTPRFSRFRSRIKYYGCTGRAFWHALSTEMAQNKATRLQNTCSLQYSKSLSGTTPF